MAVITAVLGGLTYVVASTDLPLRDAELISLDRWLGIDWRSLIAGFMSFPRFTTILNYAYASLGYQFLVAAPCLFLIGYTYTGILFVLSWSIALMLTVIIFPFMPALGGYLHYGISQSEVPHVLIGASWLYADSFYAARAGAMTALDLARIDGIVTFPSFHAAAALLLGWSFRNVPFLRWPMISLNILMWISAVPIGAHYISDVLGGSAVAIVAIAASQVFMNGAPSASRSLAELSPALAPVGAAFQQASQPDEVTQAA